MQHGRFIEEDYESIVLRPLNIVGNYPPLNPHSLNVPLFYAPPHPPVSQATKHFFWKWNVLQ